MIRSRWQVEVGVEKEGREEEKKEVCGQKDNGEYTRWMKT